MNIKKNIFSVLAVILIAGCIDLDYNEVTTTDENWTYDNPLDGIGGMVTDVYAQMFNDFKYNYEGALKASVTDEAEFATLASSVHNYYNGGWSASNPFSNTWKVSYNAIAGVHNYLERIDKINLEEYRYNDEYATYVQKFELYPYELRFLRAYFYFELAKTYGDVPLVTTSLTTAQANSVPRTPVQDVFRFIVDECDAIAEYLPYSYMNEPGQEIGRANRAAVLGLKARTLLYAASPLFNTNGNKELWKEAAAASKELIDRVAAWGIALGKYSDLTGDQVFINNKELIIGLGVAANNNFERAHYPIGIEGGSSGNCPAQSLVDAYEYVADGKTFKEKHPGTVNITKENPYEGLDPRFALTIVKNGDLWPSNSTQLDTIKSYIGGSHGLPTPMATPTGYYLRKFVNGNSVTTFNNSTSYRHTWITMRLAEVYLNYAEAMYNYYGDATVQGEFGMSANEAINVLRNRPDIMMPNFEGNAGFEERYMRERMVELAFEDHRFWDVRRWKKGAEFFKTVSAADLRLINNEIVLNRKTITRQWNDSYNLYPIPDSERQKNKNLTQNNGW